MHHDYSDEGKSTRDPRAAAEEPPSKSQQLDVGPKAQRSAMRCWLWVSKAKECEIEGGLDDVDSLDVHLGQRDPW